MNIFERMSEIAAEISTVAKNLEVGFGNGRYKAVSEADVLRAVKPIEKRHGVYSYPVSREIIESGTMERETKNGKSVSVFCRVKVIYRFVCADDPSSYLDIVSFGDGVDAQDKAPGKAMTYADKYALLKAYKIQTGDDPDQEASQPQTAILTSQRKALEDYVVNHYDKENLGKMLGYFGAKSVSALTDEQLAKAYAQKKSQEGKGE